MRKTRSTATPNPEAAATKAPGAGRRPGTQLRLVLPDSRATRARRPRRAEGVRTPRPAVGWGDWRLDAPTRRAGRKGVAAARAALDQASARIAS